MSNTARPAQGAALSPEMKQLINATPDPSTTSTTAHPAPTAQSTTKKYDSLLQRKRYEHHCFLTSVALRLQSGRHDQAKQREALEQKQRDEVQLMLSHLLGHHDLHQ